MHTLPPRHRLAWRVTVATRVAARVGAGRQLGAAPQVSAATTTLASLRPTDPWNTFTADITIRRKQVAEDGKPVSSAPTVTYRWEQQQVPWGWKTTMTLGQQERQTSQSLLVGSRELDSPVNVARAEDHGDGSPLRIFDKNGRSIDAQSLDVRKRLERFVGPRGNLPLDDASDAARSRKPGARGKEWLESIVADPRKASARRSRLERKYGKTVGQAKGFDRRLARTADGAVEVLSDRTSGLPVEINVSRNGGLESHTAIAYVRGADDTVVRRAVHREQLLPNGRGRRVVTDVEFSNVRLENRSGR